MKILIIIIYLLGLNNVNASNADMQIDIEIPNTSNLTRGDVVPFTLTITNNGPDNSDSLAIIYNDSEINDNIFALSNLSFTVDESIDQECEFAPINANDTIPNTGPDFIGFYFVLMPDLPANSSVSCRGFANVSIYKITKIDFHAVVRQTDNDNDLSNNTQSVIFNVKPTAIPLLSRFSFVILTLIFILLGCRQINFPNKLE